jgi:deoxyribose-phosphate aldolase
VFKGFCPYEIGDNIMFKAFGGIKTIKDIRTIHYLASGRTEFEVQTDIDWMPVDNILKRIE